MAFTVSLAAKPKKNIAFVFFLFEGDHLDGQPLFGFLEAAERKYMKNPGMERELKLKEKEIRIVLTPGIGRRLLFIGLGKKADFSTKKAGIAIRIAVQAARKEKLVRFAYSAVSHKTSQRTIEAFEIAASNAAMANFEFVKYKTPPREGFTFLDEVQVVVPVPKDARVTADIKEGIRRGMVIGEETNACRALSNTPGGDMTPELLARHAVAVAKEAGGIKATILDKAQMKRLGMGGVLGVGKGSDIPPRFIILEYMHGPKGGKPVVLVGKGVTFDTGGLNVKAGEHMYEMHMDMSGGSAVIHALIAAARLNLKKNIVAIVPAVENMLSGSSYRPGDLLRTMNGKTIEVLNTDAEGRVILSDALEYSKRYDPAIVIDVATLTGAAMRALGTRYSALFTVDKALEERFRTLGDAVGDPLWPLPLSDEHENDVKGTFADWANVGKPDEAGASSAAAFLWQFIKGYPWVHLDIAPRMTASDEEHLAKGALGTPVRLLVRYLEE